MINKQVKTWVDNNPVMMNLEIYEGFYSLKDLHDYMEKIRVLPGLYVVVKFLGMYYAVMIETYDKEVMIGKDTVWYRLNSYMNCTRGDTFKMPYSIQDIKKVNITDAIYKDLSSLDGDIEIWMIKNGVWTEIKKYKYARTYVTLLGLTFYVDMFNKNNYYEILSRYFDAGYYGNLFKHGIVEFNPFQSKVKHSDGRISQYRFF